MVRIVIINTRPNGSKYDGGWEYGKRHGRGKMTINGAEREGEWIEDKRIRWNDWQTFSATKSNK